MMKKIIPIILIILSLAAIAADLYFIIVRICNMLETTESGSTYYIIIHGYLLSIVEYIQQLLLFLLLLILSCFYLYNFIRGRKISKRLIFVTLVFFMVLCFFQIMLHISSLIIDIRFVYLLISSAYSPTSISIFSSMYYNLRYAEQIILIIINATFIAAAAVIYHNIKKADYGLYAKEIVDKINNYADVRKAEKIKKLEKELDELKSKIQN